MLIPICNYRRIRAKNCSWLIADRSDDSGQFPLLSTQSIIHPPRCWATYQATKPFTKHRTTVKRPSKRTLKLLTYNAIQTNLFFWFVQTGLIMASWHCFYFTSLNTYKKYIYIFMHCKILYNANLPTLSQMMCLLPVSELSRNKVQVQPWHLLLPLLREHSLNTHFWKSGFCDVTLTSLKYLAG